MMHDDATITNFIWLMQLLMLSTNYNSTYILRITAGGQALALLDVERRRPPLLPLILSNVL